MAKSLEPLEKLGESVSSILAQASPERARAIDEARHSVLQYELGSRPPPPRRVVKPAVWIGGVGLALLAAVVLLLSQRHDAITFEVNGTRGVARTWLAAPPESALQLQFSEGTKVRLEPASRARVVDVDAHGASLSLESGALHAEVVHRVDSAWKVVAGPFTVTVTGTVFDVNWDPNSEQLAVSVGRGSVAVRESNGGTERSVHASQTLRVGSSDHRLELGGSDAGSAIPSVAIAPAQSSDMSEQPPLRDGASAAEESNEPVAPREDTARPSPWREYAKRGALREAFASADAVGFAASCASASPADLLLLGDGARLSGKPERAVEALLALRRRFPKDPRRAAAAFALGKVAFDQRGAYEQAAEWFSTALREQPNGPLSREASGRLIEALRRADDSAGARRAARDYLGKYPEGPHADLARSVLN